jgi:hypothetical protein
MLKRSMLVIGLLLGTSMLYAQQEMEMFIPIGKSPGVSNKTSIIGAVVSIDDQHRTLTMTDSAGTYTVTIPDGTMVWLDRSKVKGTNEIGSPADIKPGLTIEVKHKEPKRAASVAAEWIKVQVTD